MTDTTSISPHDGNLFDAGLYPLFDLSSAGAGKTAKLAKKAKSLIKGTKKSERLDGTGKDDTVEAGKGKDTVNGKGGDDVLDGGKGDDTLNGNSGDDQLLGGAGDDVLEGGSGKDMLNGGDGTDTASYATAKKGVVVRLTTPTKNKGVADGDEFNSIENIIGSKKSDELWGDDGDNVIHGGGGKDELNGINGNDTLHGGNGKDLLEGGNDDDVLHGDAGNDTIEGNAGADIIEGGSGRDKLEGWGDADIFFYRSIEDSTVEAKGRDIIEDFAVKKDDIDLTLIDADTGTTGDDEFAFIGTAAFSSTAGELRYVIDGDRTFIYGDVNGDATADFAIELTGAMDLNEDGFLL